MLSDLARRNAGPTRSPSPVRGALDSAGQPEKGKGKGKSKKGKRKGKGKGKDKQFAKGKGKQHAAPTWTPTPPTRDVLMAVEDRPERGAAPLYKELAQDFPRKEGEARQVWRKRLQRERARKSL